MWAPSSRRVSLRLESGESPWAASSRARERMSPAVQPDPGWRPASGHGPPVAFRACRHWSGRPCRAKFRSRRSCSPSVERNRMMARTRRSRRSYGAGEWGRNRVRVFPDPKTGLFQLEWRENGRRLSRSLKHRDWRRAKRQADEFAAGFIDAPNGKAEAKREPLTLDKLFEIYGEEVTPTKAEASQRSDRAATRMFLRFFGRGRSPETLSQRDWDRFIKARRSGRVGPSGRPVSDRTIEHDLKFLIAVLNWASKSRDERGKLLLASNPLRGLRTPTEKNPTRVVLSEEEYQALLGVSQEVDWRFRVALVLAHETGHRIGAIRQLRFSDIDFEGGVVRWRAEHEKTGYEHRTPVTAEALAVLHEARERSSGHEDAPVLPAPRDPSKSAGRSLVRVWWYRAQSLAGLEPKRGRGWHSLRRKFASDLMDQPLKVLCELGGWKTAKTVLECYQR
ncbi:MAG: site-specific integrase, partial [Acidobacteria bacterium]|nr:site-specific integrase [Acidobacteriota bacterium]